MPPDADQIEDALQWGVNHFLKNLVQKIMAPAAAGTPIGDANPVDYGWSLITQTAGPPVYGILKRPGGDAAYGDYHSTGPGGVDYTELKIVNPVQLLFLNRENHCTYTFSLKRFTENSVTHWDEVVTVNFKDPLPPYHTVAVYEITRKNMWGGSQTNPKFEYWIKPISHDDPNFAGVGWSTYQFLDMAYSNGKKVWDSTSSSTLAQAGPIPPVAQYPIKLNNIVQMFFDEMGNYWSDNNLHDIASRIRGWVQYWQNTYGIMRVDYLDVLWGYQYAKDEEAYRNKYKEGWLENKLKDQAIFYDPDFWQRRWYMLGLSAEKSQLVTLENMAGFIAEVWKDTIYHKVLEQIDISCRGVKHWNAVGDPLKRAW